MLGYQAICRTTVRCARGPAGRTCFTRAFSKQRATAFSPGPVAAASSGQQLEAPTTPAWEIRLLYDGECPLCMREVNFLRDRDKETRKIDFVDIASADYDPGQNAGISYDQAMAVIHAILADGRVLTGVGVFRRLYEAVGLGWVYAITAFEPAGRLADALYAVWAKYRIEITGREGGMAAVLARKRAEREGRLGRLCEGQLDCELPARETISTAKKA